jgi:hypothetical protein
LLAVFEDILVGGIVQLLNLVALESHDLKSPVLVLDIVDLGCNRGDDAEIVTSSLNSPPKLRVGVNGSKSAICKNDVHRLELISNKAMTALKPPMTAT